MTHSGVSTLRTSVTAHRLGGLADERGQLRSLFTEVKARRAAHLLSFSSSTSWSRNTQYFGTESQNSGSHDRLIDWVVWS
jgi:hypothetical protein